MEILRLCCAVGSYQWQPLHLSSPQCLSFTGCMTVWRYLLFSTGCIETPCNWLHYRHHSLGPHSSGFYYFLFFFEHSFSLFFSFFPPLIPLPLKLKTSGGFPCHFTFLLLLDIPFLDFLLLPCPFPSTNNLFHIFLCSTLIQKALAIFYLPCLTLYSVQETCLIERAGSHLTSITSEDENEFLRRLSQGQKETQLWTGGTYQKVSVPGPVMKTSIGQKIFITQLKKNVY